MSRGDDKAEEASEDGFHVAELRTLMRGGQCESRAADGLKQR